MRSRLGLVPRSSREPRSPPPRPTSLADSPPTFRRQSAGVTPAAAGRPGPVGGDLAMPSNACAAASASSSLVGARAAEPGSESTERDPGVTETRPRWPDQTDRAGPRLVRVVAGRHGRSSGSSLTVATSRRTGGRFDGSPSSTRPWTPRRPPAPTRRRAGGERRSPRRTRCAARRRARTASSPGRRSTSASSASQSASRSGSVSASQVSSAERGPTARCSRLAHVRNRIAT